MVVAMYPRLTGRLSPLPTLLVGVTTLTILVLFKYRGPFVFGRSALILNCLLLCKCSISKGDCVLQVTKVTTNTILAYLMFCEGRGGEIFGEGVGTMVRRFSLFSSQAG